MFFRKKKEKTSVSKAYKNRTMKLVSDKISYEIGKTRTKVKFKDGHEMETLLYGTVSQHTDQGRDETGSQNCVEPVAYSPTLSEAIEVAKSYLQSFNFNCYETITDDPKNPTVSYLGEVLAKEIIKTEKYSQEFDIYRVVPKDS